MTAKARMSRDEQLRTLLTEKGIRVTDQRMIVLRELVKVRSPISHPELTERLERSSLDRATIYRNLLSLTEAGILVRSQLGDNVWRFELMLEGGADHGTHPHLVCSDCGTVKCLSEATVSFHGEALRSEVDEVQLRGRCSACTRT